MVFKTAKTDYEKYGGQQRNGGGGGGSVTSWHYRWKKQKQNWFSIKQVLNIKSDDYSDPFDKDNVFFGHFAAH